MEVKKEWLEWLASGDTGISSETMFSAITGVPVQRNDVPHDIGDFGRCHRMLKATNLRDQIGKVVEKFPSWTPYIDCWIELENLYEECRKWEKLSQEEQKAMKKKKYFEVPNDKFWKLMEELRFASRYMGGMRIQNYSNHWRNQPPNKF